MLYRISMETNCAIQNIHICKQIVRYNIDFCIHLKNPYLHNLLTRVEILKQYQKMIKWLYARILLTGKFQSINS